MSRQTILCFSLLTALATVHAAHAQPGASSVRTAPANSVREPMALADQQLRSDVQIMLSNAAASGALGPQPGLSTLKLDEPPRRVANLGTLVDSTNAANAHDGLHVLGATPGSSAEHLGLRPGDVIVAVNGVSLRGLGADSEGRAMAASTLRSTVDNLPDNATLDMQVVRDGNSLALNGPLQTMHLPALHMEIGPTALAASEAVTEIAASAPAAVDNVSAGCGRISVFDVAPRNQHMYHARILLLDGVTPGPNGVPSFRVSAGEHHLLVAENIPTPALGIGEIATLRRQTSKPLTVVVQPGMTSMVAAQLHIDKASDLSHGTYWDPVVWREISEKCR